MDRADRGSGRRLHLVVVLRDPPVPIGDQLPHPPPSLGLDELTGVNEILTAKATPEEADAFRRWLLAAAQAAADGAKEGGFMGFGAELVSQGEQRMLDELRTALGVPVG